MIDLQKIIDAKKFDKRKFAEHLFPNAGHPLMALQRIMNGTAELSADQYRALSEVTEIPLAFLMAKDWTVYSSAPAVITFVKGEVLVDRNYATSMAQISVIRSGQNFPIFKLKSENVPLKIFLNDITDLVIGFDINTLKSLKNE